MNLIEGLQSEMNRVREIIKVYETIPTGALAATMMKMDIAETEKAIATGDTVEMMRCYEDLKGYTL